MKFDAVTIKNFRNFEDITIDLTRGISKSFYEHLGQRRFFKKVYER